jgi:hypothetical protein
MGRSSPWGAKELLRLNSTRLTAFLDAYGTENLIDSGTNAVYDGSGPLAPTLDGFLLDRWFTNKEVYDAFLLRQVGFLPALHVVYLSCNDTMYRS